MSSMSWVLMMVSYSVTLLKAFTHPLNGSTKCSVNNITNLYLDIFVTITTILWNSVTYTYVVLVCLNSTNSLKWISRSLFSNLSINLWVKYTYDVMSACPNVTIPWYHHSCSSPSKCKVENTIYYSSVIGLSWK